MLAQNAPFVADSPTAAMLESLHAAVMLAQVCNSSGQDVWSFNMIDLSLLLRLARHTALEPI
jgi:hypothetical protein